jgi:hypothetical protein
MISRANIVKCSAALIVFTVVFFFVLRGHASSKVVKTLKAVPYTDSKSANTDTAKHEPVKAAVNTASVKVNAAALKNKVQAIAVKSELNSYVLKVIPTYKGEKYPYLLNNDYENYNGVTENIIYKGSLIAKANPDGSKSSHCVGLTYEVFFKAMQKRNKEAGISLNNFNNMTIDNMKDFLLTWYAAKGTLKAEGNQLAGAIVKYGIGTQITRLEDAKAGDFIDFSRTSSGHTAVFINWLKDNKGSIVGLKYWSTQESTSGIGFKEEYFSNNPQKVFKGAVNRNQLYIGRVGPISNYRAFK